VARFKEAINRADGVLIATPAYQHGISGVLRNALDWTSRPAGTSVLRGRPVAAIGASPSQVGTARAQMQLQEILAYVQADTVAVPEVLVAYAELLFGDEARFTDEVGRRFMRQLLEELSRAVTASNGRDSDAWGQKVRKRQTSLGCQWRGPPDL
jgi:chromate reductase, NAD(P)H dehydrogenase (quinone)